MSNSNSRQTLDGNRELRQSNQIVNDDQRQNYDAQATATQGDDPQSNNVHYSTTQFDNARFDTVPFATAHAGNSHMADSLSGDLHGSGSHISHINDSRFVAYWNRCYKWWRAPHFLEKTSIIAAFAQVMTMIVAPPSSPLQMLMAIGWLAVIVALPFAPRTLCVAGPILGLLVTFLPDPNWWIIGGFPMVAVFLSLGYVMSRKTSLVLIIGFSLLDAASLAWLGAGSVGGSIIRGTVEMLNDVSREVSVESGAVLPDVHARAALPQYSLIVFVATVLLDVMILGFLVLFGTSFRRTAEAAERVARTEQLIGRLTREQELAHVIHDSVANDISTIAMLSWRAKITDDDGAMLDAIYERAHHALDRVHEVIDVLNGNRDLSSLHQEQLEQQYRERQERHLQEQLGQQDSLAQQEQLGQREAEQGQQSDAQAVDAIVNASASTGTSVSGDNGNADTATHNRIFPTEPVTESAEIGGANVGIAFDAAIDKYLEDEDRIMHMLGFVGASRVTGACDHAVPIAVRSCVMSLLEEIYANIVRHCEPVASKISGSLDVGNTLSANVTSVDRQSAQYLSTDYSVSGMDFGVNPNAVRSQTATSDLDDGYQLFVTIDNHAISITEINVIPSRQHAAMRGLRHGRGLKFQRDAITRLGGMLNTSAQDNTWTLSAQIPLH